MFREKRYGLADLYVGTLRAKRHRRKHRHFYCPTREENADYRIADPRDDHYDFGSDFDDPVCRGARHWNRLAGSENRESQKPLDTKRTCKLAIAVASLIAAPDG